MKKSKRKMGVQKSLDFIIKRMVTKSELDPIVEKMATKGELDFIIERMATKSDLEDVQVNLQKTLDDHTAQLNSIHKTVNDHTTQLNIIQTDIKTMRDKRLQLEVRVGHIEKQLHIKPPTGTVSR